MGPAVGDLTWQAHMPNDSRCKQAKHFWLNGADWPQSLLASCSLCARQGSAAIAGDCERTRGLAGVEYESRQFETLEVLLSSGFDASAVMAFCKPTLLLKLFRSSALEPSGMSRFAAAAT